MFGDIYKNKRVLVTGHTGFKGSWLSVWLLNLGADVGGYSDKIPTNPSHFDELKIQNKISHFTGDIRDYEKFKNVCLEFKPEIIFHLAAQPLVRESYQNPHETFDVNMIGTLNVAEVLRELKEIIKVGVIITSDKAYDNVEWIYGYRENDRLGGEDPYSGSKGAAELIMNSYMKSFFKDNFPNVATTRAGNVIGGGDWAKDRIVPDIVRSWEKNIKVEIRNPYSTRPWQHVLEPLSGYLNLGWKLFEKNSKFKNNSFNFGPDAAINKNVEDIIVSMQKYWKNNPGWINKSVTLNNMPEAGLLKLCCDKSNINLKWFPALDYDQTLEFTTKWYTAFLHEERSVFELTISQIKEYQNIAKSKKIEWSII